MSAKERRERLEKRLEAIAGPGVWLVGYGPGDGRTRYAIVTGERDYFGGQRLAWTGGGLRAAEEMVEAFLAGYRLGCDRREG